MRIFYALTFKNEDQNKIGHYRDIAANHIIKGRYTAIKNIHMTLAFVGEVPQSDVMAYEEILEELHLMPLTLDCRHLGTFKKKSKEILWLGTEKNPSLLDLEKQLRKALKNEGLSFDDRKFIPHITLGREIKSTYDISQLVIAPLKIKPKGVALMISHRVHDELIYEPLMEILF